MNQRGGENRLSIAYTLCVFLGATASITSGIAWGHWRETLDQCVHENCSCIFFGRHTPTHFLGGSLGPCIWITFGPLIYVLLCIGFAMYHGYRVVFGVKAPTTRTVATKNEIGEPVVIQTVMPSNTSALPKAYWITVSVFTGIFTLYCLAHFITILDGFLSTCKEYRETLIKQLGVLGTIYPVVHERLNCNAIYDFMDYIQPVPGQSFREGFINTAADLIIGIICSCFSWIVFAYATFINIKCARIKQ